VGGSPKNSVLELTLAYNGVDRIIKTKEDTAANLIPEQFRQVDSDAGFARLLNPNYSQEVGWLLISGIICTIAVLVLWKWLPAKREARATAFVVTSWFIATYLVLCFMGDQIHTYYTIALAPSLSLVIGLAVDAYVKHRHSLVSIRLAMALAVLTGSGSAWLLLNSVMGWPDWLPTAVLALGVLGASMLAPVAPNRILLYVGGVASITALLAGPLLTSLHNASVPHNGSNPVSGMLSKNTGSVNRFLDEMQQGNHEWAYNIAFGQRPSSAIVDRLERSEDCTWAAASYTSQTAARLQLEANRPVMPIGGFAGTDPSPTLNGFRDLVEAGRICYFLGHDDFLATQTAPTSVVEITDWVTANFEPEVIDGQLLYNLRAGHS
jgi:4-amino-4-deoxy-L-arabinose transferase-like glycosyltransferase